MMNGAESSAAKATVVNRGDVVKKKKGFFEISEKKDRHCYHVMFFSFVAKRRRYL